MYVERGQTYTFVIEGGNDKSNPAKYHPFYITNSPEGGFGQLSPAKQAVEQIYAGVEYDDENYPFPTAAGKYCEWQHKTIDQSATTETFEKYMETLDLRCDSGEPAYLNWTVEETTPNMVYYQVTQLPSIKDRPSLSTLIHLFFQCYTHRNLGWKIHVKPAGEKSRINAGPSIATWNFSVIFLLAVISMRVTLFSYKYAW